MGLLKKKQTAEITTLPFSNIDELYIKNAKQTARNLMETAVQITKLLSTVDVPTPVITLKDEIISVREAARILGVCDRTIGRWREEGRIPYIKITDRTYKFKKQDILSYLNKNYHTAKDYCL